MINVLIVENNPQKLGRLRDVVLSQRVPKDRVEYSLAATDAYEKLSAKRFDLMLLDINLPRRIGEADVRGEGLEILRRLGRDAAIFRPRYIIGVTEFEDVVAEFGDSFSDQLWTLIHYSASSDRWVAQISAKIDYVRAVRRSDNFTDGQTYGIDVGIVCALPLEFDSVKRLPCDWEPLRLPHDETLYLSGTLVAGDKTLSLIAATAPRMGMPASSVLSAKLISSFRPKLLAMCGICAGRSEKTALGDVVVADPSWDWGSGKIDSIDNAPRFRPSPHQIDLNVDLESAMREIVADVGALANIKQECRGKKPSHELRVHFGPMASGASVVANPVLFEGLLDNNRDLTALEMEAYGLFVASQGMAKPRPTPMVMKSVCDFADADKDDNYQEYAAETSAKTLYYVVKQLFTSGKIASV